MHFPPLLHVGNPVKPEDCLLWENPEAEKESSRAPKNTTDIGGTGQCVMGKT